ncbi:hypothetical protein [Hyphomicrobium sp.]|uniref:hypothetical protein n=1 Tax=Hyphomicrobium sp. TaxID=82 RepID=UPI0025BD4915|nr:hypothetical protein [Hyphomicrobium sp.]
MTYLLLQTFLLLLASYFSGAFVACLLKRAFAGSSAEVPEGVLAPIHLEVPDRPPVIAPPPVRARSGPRMHQPIAPRAIDPVQPKIEVLRRPEPRPAPKVLDPSRFERALIGPDPNEGVPRRAIVEIRPSVLKPVTGMYVPRPPEPEPLPEPEMPPELEPPVSEDPVPPVFPDAQPEPEAVKKPERPGGLAARLRDATTAAAAGAVAAAKAAAAASVMMPSAFGRRGAEEKTAASEDVAREPTPASEDVPLQSAEHDEPIVPLAETPAPEPEPELQPELEPAPESVPVPEVRAPLPPAKPIEGGDDFQRIRAIDADIEQKLKILGVNYFEDIAAWTASDVKRFGQDLQIPGRIDREQWVEQAQILAKGGETYYSRNRLAALKASAAASAPKPAAKDHQPQQTGASGAGSASQPDSDEPTDMGGVAAASHGRSVAEMAAAAAAAIAAASASVTRGLKPIEPISPLSKVDPKISIPARITDAIREKNGAAAQVPTAEAEEPAPSQSSDAEGPHDDLKRIRGIGVLIEKRLNALGVGSYDQIANWTSGDIDRISRSLEFKGRIERENWVEQARILASGGHTEFSRRVDRGEVDTSRET